MARCASHAFSVRPNTAPRDTRGSRVLRAPAFARALPTVAGGRSDIQLYGHFAHLA
ncbi:protein of unknown function (plasmid) [Pararobbsia alpina]